MSVSRNRGKLIPFARFEARTPFAFVALFRRFACACLALARAVCVPAGARRAPPPACTADNLLAGKAPWQQRDVHR